MVLSSMDVIYLRLWTLVRLITKGIHPLSKKFAFLFVNVLYYYNRKKEQNVGCSSNSTTGSLLESLLSE